MSHFEQGVPQDRASSPSGSLSAPFAETQATLNAGARAVREGGRGSLAEMAQRDLDAALQLLAFRAQYITGATGAAIALRRCGKNDMLCRASTGSNAPELGALLSTEFGLSGESVRTRQLLRCDDADHDTRVNRDVCRQLGIASVVVMPVVNDDEVLGVFELFSGKANAFGERDFSAVQRLSEMVETAVRLAEATQNLPERLGLEKSAPGKVETRDIEDQLLDQDIRKPQEPALEIVSPLTAMAPSDAIVQGLHAGPAEKSQGAPGKMINESSISPEPALKKPLFWSAAQAVSDDELTASRADESHVPPVLRNLHKCAACGFPVSAGRVLCVECEEKKWRGQLRSKAAVAIPSATPTTANATTKPEPRAFAAAAATSQASAAVSATAIPLCGSPISTMANEDESRSVATAPLPAQSQGSQAAPALAIEQMAKPLPSPSSAIVFSAGLEPSQSWLSRNKYILGALFVVAGAVAAIYLLH